MDLVPGLAGSGVGVQVASERTNIGVNHREDIDLFVIRIITVQ